MNCFHISIIPWKCGKILPPLCQGAKDQTCFHRVEKQSNIPSLVQQMSCVCCGWPPVQSEPVVTGTRKRSVSWGLEAHRIQSLEAVGRQGSTNQLNSSDVFSGFLS